MACYLVSVRRCDPGELSAGMFPVGFSCKPILWVVGLLCDDNSTARPRLHDIYTVY